MKSIVILGSTGSIGTQTLSVVDQNPQKFEILALSAKNNVKKLIEQILKYKPKFALIPDKYIAASIKTKIPHINTEVIYGEDRFQILLEKLTKYDILVSAMSGSVGMLPTLKLMEKAETLAIANKETVVCAGNFLLEKAQKYNVKIIPVDSEHNSLYNLIKNVDKNDIKTATITASGGSFFDKPINELQNVTINEAKTHPNWSMGVKNTIDSNTMANKVLEIIEAGVLFDLKPNQVNSVIQREQIVHGLIETKDGGISAFLSNPSMEIHIINSLLNGRQDGKNNCKKLDLLNMPPLQFFEIDKERFPIFYLGKWAFKTGFEAQIAFNTANEYAVRKFIDSEVKFTDIYKIIYKTLDQDFGIKITAFDDIFELINRVNKFCIDN